MTDQPSLLDTDPDPGGSDGPPDAGSGRRPGAGDDPRVRDVDIAERMEQSFLDYSMSVIVGRALPDVRDGLKPVQRRILYAMWEGGLRPDRPHRKAASAVGDVMRKYHPHGDSSIYDALVRMAQDFAMRSPLVDGHGNFGSIDGDGAAAMRYTEARLSAVAMELLDGIDEDTVDYVPNYDGREEEPVVLPARFPNLLVNGASGIAVGMATAVPPHNLGETIDACLWLIERPDATVDDLLEVLPGPDFPTGGRIVPGPGIRDAYLTGRGTITVEAVATTETRSGGLPRIIVTEIPYQVNKAALLERIAGLVKDRKLDEVRDLRDESSHEGLRVVVELKRGEDPARVLGKLYRLSDLRTNFNANLVALTKPDADRPPQPRTLGLREILLAYLGHQRTVLTRRTTYRRDRAAARLHVLDGLLVALDHLDEVIALIRAADTVDEARAELAARYDLTEVQATAILDMQLRRLAALERQRIVDEHRELRALIDELEAILADPAKLDGMLAEELRAVRERHADPRRTRLTTGDRPVEEGALPATDRAEETLPQLEAQPVTVYVTAGGYVKPVPSRRVSQPHPHPRDRVVAVVRATTDATLLAVDADGGGYRIALADVPVVTMRQRGTSIGQLLGDGPDGPLVGAVVLGAVETVVTVSAAGLVKRTDRAEYGGRTRMMVAAGVRDDDEIVGVAGGGDGDEVLLAHDGGQLIRFPAADVRPTGRGARGVAGLDVPAGRRVVAVSVVPPAPETEVVTLAADGGARRTALAEYPSRGRGGKGVQVGAAPLAWCGVAAALHVPTGDGTVVLEAAPLPAGRRTGALPAATPAVTGPVVPETAPG